MNAASVPAQVIEHVVKKVGAVPVILSALTVAEVGHSIFRATTPEIRERRRAFLDELKATIPVHPITEPTAEIMARVDGEQAAKGINLRGPQSLPEIRLRRPLKSFVRMERSIGTLCASSFH